MNQVQKVMDLARVGRWYIDPGVIAGEVDSQWLTSGQMFALRALSGQRYEYAWQFHRALAERSQDWTARPPATVNKIWNKELKKKLSFLDRVFRKHERDGDADDPPAVPNP